MVKEQEIQMPIFTEETTLLHKVTHKLQRALLEVEEAERICLAANLKESDLPLASARRVKGQLVYAIGDLKKESKKKQTATMRSN